MSSQAITSRLSKRQVVLFFVAIILPCSLLIALSLLIMSQQKELMEKRLAEEQRRIVDLVRHELSARLEKIKLQQVTAVSANGNRVLPTRFADPAVVLLGWVEKDRLLLPWDVNPSAERSRKLLQDTRYSGAIQKGEREEFSTGQPAKAEALYRAAMIEARDLTQVAYARLLLARVLAKSGREGEAVTHLRAIVALPPEVTDEHGIPLSVYTLQRLLQARIGQEAALELLRSEVSSLSDRPPAEVYMVRDLTRALARSGESPDIRSAANGLEQEIAFYIQRLEGGLALQNRFSKLGLNQARAVDAPGRDSLWVLYGREPWFVSVTTPQGRLPLMAIAVRANDVFASLKLADLRSSRPAPRVQWSTGPDSTGEMVGERFPGLRVRILTEETGLLADEWGLQRSFYLITLLLVLSATLFGAYLLWRDVRRELRLAEMRSQFVASVSHELKTPLTAIRMFAETLLMGRAAAPEAQTEYLEIIVNESERLTRLLNNVLDFSKMEKGRKIYRFEAASLADVVTRSARAMRYPLDQKSIRLNLEIQDGIDLVRIDPDAIEQAVLNLLVNAMKYSGAGREIALRLLRQSPWAVIEVTDHGGGIPASEQARIFEKFYRVPTPENKLIPGTGLGLTIVEHVVKAHDGRVELRSVPGEGSTFSIYLPLKGEA